MGRRRSEITQVRILIKMQCFEYFLTDDKRVLIYCGDGRVWVKVGAEDGGRHLGEFIEEEREKLEREDMKYFSRMFKILSDCEEITLVEAVKDKPVKIVKTYELFSSEHSDHSSSAKKEYEYRTKNETRKEPVILHVSKYSEFTCTICDKTYSTKPKLKKHAEKHRDERPNRYLKIPSRKTSKNDSHKEDHLRNKK